MTPEKLSQLVYAYRAAHNVLASVMTYNQIANIVLNDLDKAEALLNARNDSTLEEKEHVENVLQQTLQNELQEWQAAKVSVLTDIENVEIEAEAKAWTDKQKIEQLEKLKQRERMADDRINEINERLKPRV